MFLNKSDGNLVAETNNVGNSDNRDETKPSEVNASSFTGLRNSSEKKNS